MTGEKHILFFKKTAVCPKCGGMAVVCKSDDIIFHCVDCNTFYKAYDFGHAEAELQCEEVQIGTA